MGGLIQLDETTAAIVAYGPNVVHVFPVKVRTGSLVIATFSALLYLRSLPAGAILTGSDHQLWLRDFGGLLLIKVLAFRYNSGSLAFGSFQITTLFLSVLQLLCSWDYHFRLGRYLSMLV